MLREWTGNDDGTSRRLIEGRPSGRLSALALQSHVRTQRIHHYQPSIAVEIKNRQRGPVNHLDLDPIDGRYLLAAAGDATIGLYDMGEIERAEDEEDAPPRVVNLQVTQRAAIREPPALASLTGSARGRDGNLLPRMTASQQPGHRHSVTSVQWYPLDTGLFVSGSTDGTVRVWDTNTFTNAGTFDLTAKVYSVGISPLMSTQSLIAVGTDDHRVRLCDLKSGGNSHLLMGHSEAILSVSWSPTHEHLLASGSIDKSVRLWDIRRSGNSACLMTFDQHADHRSKAPGGPMSGPTDLAKAHDGWVVSVTFSPDGIWLLSAGIDNRLRLWNAVTGQNTMVNFVGTRTDKTLQWKISTIQPGNSSSAIVLYPTGSSGQILMFPLHGSDGRPLHTLKGHLDAVHSMVYRREAEQLITGGADGLMLVYDCSRYEKERLQKEEAASAEGEDDNGNAAAAAVDTWSDDEEEEERKEGGDRRQGYVPPIIQQLTAQGRRGGNAPAGSDSSSRTAARRSIV